MLGFLIHYLLLRIEAMGFPTFWLLLYCLTELIVLIKLQHRKVVRPTHADEVKNRLSAS